GLRAHPGDPRALGRGKDRGRRGRRLPRQRDRHRPAGHRSALGLTARGRGHRRDRGAARLGNDLLPGLRPRPRRAGVGREGRHHQSEGGLGPSL
ncbi:MAG: hypothetical protein AVDCRST_MAG45-2633, partial [uncultured Solirubrobacterales bacterium]